MKMSHTQSGKLVRHCRSFVDQLVMLQSLVLTYNPSTQEAKAGASGFPNQLGWLVSPHLKQHKARSNETKRTVLSRTISQHDS